jgi:L-rhamnose-H+ transport protein
MNILVGLLLALVGGGIQGAFFFPMKYMKKWRWENGWFIFSLVGCLILPVLLAFSTTPHLLSVYEAAGWKSVGQVFCCGLCWGVGAVLFGLGADFLGMTLGITIITGINVCFGALLPIVFLESGSVTLSAGLVLGAALALTVAGVIVISLAGRRREKEFAGAVAAAAATPAAKVPFRIGLIVCIVAGLLCPAFNFAVAFGKPISQEVSKLAAVAVYNRGNALTLLFFLGGWVVNTAYCVYLFRKNGSAANFLKFSPIMNTLRGVMMSVLFVAGAVIYTIAATTYIPTIGPVVGWPVFLSATIIVSNLLGVASGEWKGVSRGTFGWLYGGVALLIASVVLASLSNLFMGGTSV